MVFLNTSAKDWQLAAIPKIGWKKRKNLSREMKSYNTHKQGKALLLFGLKMTFIMSRPLVTLFHIMKGG